MPLLQIIPNILLFSSSLYISLKYKPFENKFMNFLTVVNEMSYILVLCFFLVLNLINKSLSPRDRYYKFGYPMILLVAITMLINMVVCLVQAISGFIDLMKECKNKRKAKKVKDKL